MKITFIIFLLLMTIGSSFANITCVENIMLVCRAEQDESISAILCNNPDRGLIALMTDGQDSTDESKWMECHRLSEKLISCQGRWQTSGRRALVVFKLGETDWDARASFNRATTVGSMQTSCDPEVISNL